MTMLTNTAARTAFQLSLSTVSRFGRRALARGRTAMKASGQTFLGAQQLSFRHAGDGVSAVSSPPASPHRAATGGGGGGTAGGGRGGARGGGSNGGRGGVGRGGTKAVSRGGGQRYRGHGRQRRLDGRTASSLASRGEARRGQRSRGESAASAGVVTAVDKRR
jgi:hypothetical protein